MESWLGPLISCKMWIYIFFLMYQHCPSENFSFSFFIKPVGLGAESTNSTGQACGKYVLITVCAVHTRPFQSYKEITPK